MIQEALCWSYLKHTNGYPHHSLLPCSPFMELIPPAPRDRATSAWEQGSKCLPLTFVFSQDLGPVSARSENKKKQEKQEKRGKKQKDEKKKHDHPRSKPMLLGTNMTWVACEGADMSQSGNVFSPFLLLMCLSPSPSLTRTKPICRETRVTDGVYKPCSCMLPWDAPFHSTLSFWVNCCTVSEEQCVMPEPALQNLIPVTHRLCYNTLAPRRVMILSLRSSPPGSWSSFPLQTHFSCKS